MAKPPGSKFGELLDLTGMTQQQFADRVGLSRGYICLLRLGRRAGDIETHRALAEALGITIDQLSDNSLATLKPPAKPIRRRVPRRPKSSSKGLIEFQRLQDRRRQLVADLAMIDARLETLLHVV